MLTTGSTGRHILILPRHSPLAARLHKKQHHKVLLGIARMFTLFPYWDVSWLIGVSFTIGCLIFVADGLFYFLPIAAPQTAFDSEPLLGGIFSLVGATLFQIGAVMLFLESYNDRAETKFGGAMEHVFVDRLHLGKRHEGQRKRHWEVTGSDVPKQGDHIPRHVPGTGGEFDLEKKNTSASSSSGSSSPGDKDKKSKDKASSADGDAAAPASHPHAERGFQPDDEGELIGEFEERSWQWLPSWHDFRTHYIYEIGFLASLTMSVGATIFYVAGIMALPPIYDTLSEGVLQGVYYFTYIFGGFLFALSSLLYILENQPTWYTPQPGRIGWHIGLWNMIGGIGWTLAAAFGGYCNYSWCEYQSQLSLTWASAAFAFGSALQWYECLDKYIVVIED